MKKYLVMIAVPVFLLLSGCEKYIEGYDVDPNNPSEITPSLLLANVEVSVFATYGGSMSRNSAILIQQMNGVSDQSRIVWANYNFKEGDITNEWLTIYTGILINAQTIIDKFGDENPYYAGIARIMEAFGFGVATDYWGNIPMKEALKGLSGSESDFSPHYDSQESIIQGIQDLLDQAILDLSKDPAQNILRPGDDDYIFQGDVEKWKNTAWILKARYAMRLTKREPLAAQTALQYLSNVTATGTEMDAYCIFGEQANENNQWYAFQLQRGGYMKMGKFFIDLLKGADDPRLPFFASLDLDSTYSGAPLGSQGQDFSDIGLYYASATSPIPLVTYVEAKFLEAEASFRQGDKDKAAQSHNEAVLTSVQKITGALPHPSFVQSFASETAETITLEKIMTQKYIALFTQLENYADWRRTGIPSLIPNPSGYTTVIPRRFPTPQDERINNLNAEVVSDIKAPVWWDE
jgi:hypothetical protein